MDKILKRLAVTSVAAAAAGGAMAAAGGAERVFDPAPGWDYLWKEVLIDISVIGILFALMTAYLIWRYRRTPDNVVGSGPRLSPAAAVGWVVIPTFVFMADDFFIAANGWALWNKYRDVPADRLEIQLESGMYSWDYTYPNGVQTQNELIVPAGKPILLRMTSRDTLHSHFIPDFRVKEDSMPGRVTYIWFLPKEAGKEHLVTCAEYCGVMHSYMAGRVVVKTPEEFKAWYETSGASAKKSS
ncbi:MAG TPA: cytochrome c oxidase subunit II, partial [Accumulibacter sp.]|uniref:cytochrome c oxidase subunit II n=1 Tax=Accumulibacter sp. TaxID=2053492 RepID=UPI002614D647|nr:cytochrome c oxidase subunit II [Accumulibacter sp.]MDS4053636.1 cytochrome c oxidase subunit II [Accumulibacter sp.]HMV06226.1 cytochrome c oxidase subunit II [Accumulibacter sp.]HMW63432.1 cytochrome c oxidase subunit II [Accumulibacter sp.]HMW79126.1 cytochrome c oxidase subunit II [Accumulibacter sp.]HMX68824.1 cytochrome c oxidase subunit II [Accumulibacter sp.]